jgi:hypothetical protein
MSAKTSDIKISERTAWKSTPGKSSLLIAGSRKPLARNQAGKEKRNPYWREFNSDVLARVCSVSLQDPEDDSIRAVLNPHILRRSL